MKEKRLKETNGWMYIRRKIEQTKERETERKKTTKNEINILMPYTSTTLMEPFIKRTQHYSL